MARKIKITNHQQFLDSVRSLSPSWAPSWCSNPLVGQQTRTQTKDSIKEWLTGGEAVAAELAMYEDQVCVDTEGRNDVDTAALIAGRAAWRLSLSIKDPENRDKYLRMDPGARLDVEALCKSESEPGPKECSARANAQTNLLPAVDSDELDKEPHEADLARIASELGQLASGLEPEQAAVEFKLRCEFITAERSLFMTRLERGRILASYKILYGPSRKWSEFCRIVNLPRQTAYDLMAAADEGELARADKCTESVHSSANTVVHLTHRAPVPGAESAVEDEEEGEIGAEEADRIVSNVLVMSPPDQRELVQDDPFVLLTREEKQHFAVRLKIRTALTNVEPDQKLSTLVAALEEEMFSIWGQSDPVTVTITPRTSAYTLDGRKRRGEVA
jgi:hypothetical protein